MKKVATLKDFQEQMKATANIQGRETIATPKSEPTAVIAGEGHGDFYQFDDGNGGKKVYARISQEFTVVDKYPTKPTLLDPKPQPKIYERKVQRNIFVPLNAGQAEMSLDEITKLVQDKLTTTKSNLVWIQSHFPILNDYQKLAISNGLTTIDDIANRQAVRDNEGNLALSGGKITYRETTVGKSDIDLRGEQEEWYVPSKGSELYNEFEMAKASQLADNQPSDFTL